MEYIGSENQTTTTMWKDNLDMWHCTVKVIQGRSVDLDQWEYTSTESTATSFDRVEAFRLTMNAMQDYLASVGGNLFSVKDK